MAFGTSEIFPETEGDCSIKSDYRKTYILRKRPTVFSTLLISAWLILVPKALILGEDAPDPLCTFLFVRKMFDNITKTIKTVLGQLVIHKYMIT